MKLAFVWIPWPWHHSVYAFHFKGLECPHRAGIGALRIVRVWLCLCVGTMTIRHYNFHNWRSGTRESYSLSISISLAHACLRIPGKSSWSSGPMILLIITLELKMILQNIRWRVIGIGMINISPSNTNYVSTYEILPKLSVDFLPLQASICCIAGVWFQSAL